jgi:predicted DNA-binding transcriptional regulator AlpA
MIDIGPAGFMRAPERPAEPVALLRLPQVLDRVGMSRSGWYKAVAEGRAPQPVKLGRSSRWRSDDIAALIDALSMGRGMGRDSESSAEPSNRAA